MEGLEAVERPKKMEGLEAVERSEKIERSEAVARLEINKRSEAVARLETNKRSEAVARLETERMRIYRKADPPEGGEGGRKRTASRWYRTRRPDRVLPKEAVVP